MIKKIGIVLALILITMMPGCSDEAVSQQQKKLNTEAKAETEASMEKVSGQGESEDLNEQTTEAITSDDLFQFISDQYSYFSREDFEKWTKTYMDVTGDGENEVICSADYGDGGLDFAIVITSDDEELREISRYIPLEKYGNIFEVRDGFFVHIAKSGGTGTQVKTMNLYYYGGYALEYCSQSVLISENVSNKGMNYAIKSNIEGTLDNFVVTYTKEELINSTTHVIAKDHYIFDPDSYCIWYTPLSLKNIAKSFDSVYNGSNFIEVLKYYNDNLYYFGESERKAFSKRIIDEIKSDKEILFNPYYNSLEGYEFLYDRNSRKIDISRLDETEKQIINKIEERGIYQIVKAYFTTEGDLEDYGFGIMLNRWSFDIISVAYNDVVERYNPDDFSDLQPFYVPQIFFDERTPLQTVTQTHIVYPNVYVNSMSDIERLKGQDTWKTELLIPVDF